MNLLERLKELDKAGDAATAGRWCTEQITEIISINHDENGEYSLDIGETDEVENVRFITAAANSRPTIKDAIARIEELEGETEMLGESLSLSREYLRRVDISLAFFDDGVNFAVSEIERLREALEKLLRLGNGERIGNRQGNILEQKARHIDGDMDKALENE